MKISLNINNSIKSVVGTSNTLVKLSKYDIISQFLDLVSAVCQRLGIKMCNVQYQVKKWIFEKLKIDGFISLVKSADLLCKIVESLGFFKKQEKEEDMIMSKDKPDSTNFTLSFGKVSEVSKVYNNTDYYFFAIQDEYIPITLFFLNIRTPKLYCNKLFYCESFTYYKNKDPP